MPLLTTVPASIRKPIRDTMEIFTLVSHRSPKAPIREKGMVVMTMTEYRIDSNWIAMTTKTRKTAVAMAP